MNRDAKPLIFPIKFGEVAIIERQAEYPTYCGDCEVVSLPDCDYQLATTNSVVKTDIVIKKIPYQEVDNEYGTTISISS